VPPVLILHLKRFQYDNAGGTQKIWKKIGYPLELQIPKEVFPPNRRAALMAGPQGLPMYRLIGVVYHHGRNASGGHYTVDVRRQEGREWIRLDDTVISRVRSEEVANEGGEEDPKVLAKALEQHKNDSNNASKNLYAGFDDGADEDEDNDVGWSQVNGHAEKNNGHKKYSSVANATTNGSATPSTVGKQTPKDTSKYGLKDNKSPYLLIYQSMEITRQT
jgi:ubiquitin carboxyl-terminal hydrolase 10